MYVLYPTISRVSPERCKELITLADQITERCPAEPEAIPGQRAYQSTYWKPTVALYEPLLQDIFPGHWLHASLMFLPPMNMIHFHVDRIRADRRRKHLVLQTNPSCWVFHDGAWQQLEAGLVYFMDPTKVHGAVNSGDTVRVQFFVDRVP